MEYIKSFMDIGIKFLSMPITVGSVTFSFWQITLVTLVLDITIIAVKRIFFD